MRHVITPDVFPTDFVLELWAGGTLVSRTSLSSTVWAPRSVGTKGDVQVDSPTALPVHAWVSAYGGRLYAMSARPERPAHVFERALDSSWSEVPVPCLLRCGGAVVTVTRCATSRSGERESIGEAPTMAVPARRTG